MLLRVCIVVLRSLLCLTKHVRFKIFFGLILSPCITFAAPIIGIGSMYDVLKPESQSLMKRIYNSGESTAFIRIEILEIYPNEKKEVPLTESNENRLERNRLVVTPLRLIVSPSGFQNIRMMWVGERDEERYFRVRFTPVVPESKDGFGLSDNEIEEYKNTSLKAGVNILTGYGSVLIIQPKKPVFNTVIENTDSKVDVKNLGNTTIALDGIQLCNSTSADCIYPPRQIILPGRTFSVAKESTHPKINITLIEGDSSKLIVY